MYIAVDGNEANTKQRVGSNVYAYRILQGLHALDTSTRYQIFLKKEKANDLPHQNKFWKYDVFGPAKLWTQWRLPLKLATITPKPAIFFTPGHYAPRFSPVPTVISIMDLAYLYYPDAFQPKVLRQIKSWTKYSVKKAHHIFAISESTKADLVKEYQIPAHQISVTHLGSNIKKPAKWNNTEKQKTLKKYNIPSNYFIFIGTRQPRKNLDTLIKAFKSVQATERNIFLVIVGKTWHQFADAELNVGSNVILTGYVPDEDLPKLILGAEALVLPSLYEGFGIPVLEAMNLGTIVTASNVSSIPEITGKHPLLFNPRDEREITQKLTDIITMKQDNKKKIIREGKIRATQFTWQKCAKKTIEVLHELAS